MKARASKKQITKAQNWLLDIKNYIQNIQGEWKQRDEDSFKVVFNILFDLWSEE